MSSSYKVWTWTEYLAQVRKRFGGRLPNGSLIGIRYDFDVGVVTPNKCASALKKQMKWAKR